MQPLARNPWYQRLVSLVPQPYAYASFYLVNAYPLDMSQYPRLFKSTRIPRPELDELVTPDPRARHVVVQRGPRFYRLEVLTEAYEPIPVGDIESQIRAILADSAAVAGPADGTVAREVYAAEPPVGALTGAPRGAWAAARELMHRSPLNAASLAAIDSALFVLTLDDATPSSHETLSRAMLHGDVRNRWFDKCFNVIVCANGRAGVAWEHAWGDGVALLYYFNEVFTETQAAPARVPSAPRAGGLPASARLSWDLSDARVVQAIRDAEAYSDGVVAATQLQVYQTESLTKDDIKRSKLSPDGVMQM
jgi:carnitine O-palmitoyltransferase 2